MCCVCVCGGRPILVEPHTYPHTRAHATVRVQVPSKPSQILPVTCIHIYSIYTYLHTCMLELQGPSKTPAPKTPAQQGTPGAPHPIGPSSSPSVCSGLYGAARSPAHSLPGGYRLVRHAAAEGTTNDSVPTQLSTPSSLRSSSACLPTVPTVRKRGCPAVHCVGTRPNQRQSIASAAIARRRPARRPEFSFLAHRPAQRRSPRPTAPCHNPRAMPRG